MSVVDASRRLVSELASMIDKKIRVVLSDGRYYDGVLVGFDHPGLNIMLRSAVDEKGNRVPRVMIKGERISEIVIMEEPLFNPEEFKEWVLREMKIPDHMVKVIPEARVVEVQGRYRVGEDGVIGSGPIAETLHSIYKKYMEYRRKLVQG
ncbi:Lsm family RNA-binding protein [Desulfurococcus mucosus]|uniref:Like-Sm ribonucleoprotein core n=1 Tax=Desulfurococcus mucosus (strain ATCC 35584 / DSM 2162 / JCM 9187 / O7/1) TaxID=765177 RepID=E8R778_DESM0|nr:Lsm family RNA-binding protein [Desulfurococcus mucosus]ADV65543.1 Like-Sm ribonucleoprotein core [Desulfurococcus mucosus DSM 2162]